MTWQQLKNIIDENRAEAEKPKKTSNCPECGFTQLKENKDKVLLCPICGWTGRR